MKKLALIAIAAIMLLAACTKENDPADIPTDVTPSNQKTEE